MVSAWMPDKMMWPLSMIMIARVRRPCEASIRRPACLASSRRRRIGAESGVTMATILPVETAFPNPIFNNPKDDSAVLSFEVLLEGRGVLFNVLHLFPNFFQLALHQDNPLGDLGIVGFGTDRVGLPMHLLNKKIKAPSHRFRRLHDGRKLRQVAFEPREFLAAI